MRLLRRMLRLFVIGRADGVRRRVARAVTGNFWPSEPVPTPSAPVAPVAPPPVDREGWTDVGAWSELEHSGLMEVRVAGEPVALALIDGEAHAVSNTCLHAGGPLAEGTVEGHAIVCPYHGWSYDLTNGRCLVDDQLALARYEVRRTAGRIALRQATAASGPPVQPPAG